ncbi:hypothetical protein SCHPADRAFT_910667 [Schizopora paradoxa]|uniref:Uncharacterized protein n=1 Tax=Schizopora paradoxa TaxID=27342 RepID=A0A0H2R933_9AGAM|nr:hypothetical protein SCHPADRAFT_910667 [Schizopora paradoxa]
MENYYELEAFQSTSQKRRKMCDTTRKCSSTRSSNPPRLLLKDAHLGQAYRNLSASLRSALVSTHLSQEATMISCIKMASR